MFRSIKPVHKVNLSSLQGTTIRKVETPWKSNVQTIELDKLRWAGYVTRITDEVVLKKLLKGNLDHTKGRGSPQLGQEGTAIKEAMALLKVSNCKVAGRDTAIC